MFGTDDVEKLSKVLRAVSDEQGANAAVALLLKQSAENASVLFVKRVENSADPWSGQVAFPGGKRDPADLDLKQTVIRETLEEVGIDLHVGCHFLGVLTALKSAPRPDVKVLPFVVSVERDPVIKLSERELTGFFWVPLNELVQSEDKVRLGFGVVSAFVVDGTVIWGLTFRMLKDLIGLLKG